MLALTHLPSPDMARCLRMCLDAPPVDGASALRQHEAYRNMLQQCGATVRTLDVNLRFPDCVFIEDTAIVLDEVAIICSLGHPSRRGEAAGVERELCHYREIRRIELPATIDGGDVLRVGRRLMVGMSGRTNLSGVGALATMAARFGYEVDPVSVSECLHLKSACTALPDGRLLANTAWLDGQALQRYEILPVPPDEPNAANVALVGEMVCASARHARTIEMIRDLGFSVEATDLSEFAKADGCATCLSLLLEN